MYTPDDYTSDDVLKVSPLMWLVIAFLSRHLLTFLVGGVSMFMGSRRGVDTSGISQLLGEPMFIVASFPALLVVAAHFRRVPQAGPLPRKTWRYGRWLLIIAALLDVALLIAHVVSGAQPLNEWLIAVGFIDAYIVTFLIRSKRVADTFAEFPVKA